MVSAAFRSILNKRFVSFENMYGPRMVSPSLIHIFTGIEPEKVDRAP